MRIAYRVLYIPASPTKNLSTSTEEKRRRMATSNKRCSDRGLSIMPAESFSQTQRPRGNNRDLQQRGSQMTLWARVSGRECPPPVARKILKWPQTSDCRQRRTMRSPSVFCSLFSVLYWSQLVPDVYANHDQPLSNSQEQRTSFLPSSLNFGGWFK